MKAIKIAGVIMMILLVGMPFAFAEDTNQTTQDQNGAILTPTDENEIQLMKTPYGAEVRLLQLERKITQNSLKGREIIRIIEKNHSDANTQKAKGYLDELEFLIPEINVLKEADYNAMTLAAQFVAIKKEANNLIKDFRTETRQYIDSNDTQEIQKAIKDLNLNLGPLNEKIKNAIKNHNAERIQKAFQTMGQENQALHQQIMDGNADMNKIRNSFKETYQAMTLQERQEAKAKILQESAKKIIIGKEIMNYVKEKNFQQVQIIKEQIQNRLRNKTGGNNQ